MKTVKSKGGRYSPIEIVQISNHVIYFGLCSVIFLIFFDLLIPCLKEYSSGC